MAPRGRSIKAKNSASEKRANEVEVKLENNAESKGSKRKRTEKNVKEETPKKLQRGNTDRGSSDRENEMVPVKSNVKRKPFYSLDYLADLEGKEMRCSICDFTVTKAQEAKDHLLTKHYYCARMNDSTAFSMKEIRSALLLASRSLAECKFVCVCGKVALSPQTFGIHLDRCDKHDVQILVEANEIDQKPPSRDDDASEIMDISNGKPKRKSALKAATTFKQIAQDDPPDAANVNFSDHSNDGDFKMTDKSESSESEYDEEKSESDAECGGSSPIKKAGTSKSIEVLLTQFNGKYRNPIPVPIPDNERSRWRSSIQRNGRIKCLICEVSYTTVPGIEYHYQRCDKIDFGFKCLKCGICFSRSGHRNLVNHLIMCYEVETSSSESPVNRNRFKFSKCHSLSFQDYKEFTEKHYTKDKRPVHPKWRYKPAMWPKSTLEECMSYLPPIGSSPLLKFKDDETKLERFGTIDDKRNKHNTINAGGAVWCVKWLPLTLGCDLERSSDGDDQEDTTQYFMTVSHSKGDEPQYMVNVGSIGLAKGYLTLWQCDNNGDNIKRCYTICHQWGFVPRIDFCPSRSVTTNRIGILATTSQTGFVRIFALPRCVDETDGAFFIEPIPVAFLEPAIPCGSLCLAWDPLRNHDNMLVGYANGRVDMFTLKENTLLVTEEDALECSKHIGDHGMSVTAVQWHMIEDRRIAVSVGLDPQVSIWDVDQGVLLGRYIRSTTRDMKTLQFVPSIITSYEEYVSINPSVFIHESGAYKRGDSTILLHTSATPFSIDINHWRHMLTTGDSAGRVCVHWMTNGTKIQNFKARGLHLTLYEVKQTFPENVDATSQDVAQNVGILAFKDYSPSWEEPMSSSKAQAPSRFEYPLNSVLSVAFNMNFNCDQLVLSGLRCGLIRISKIKYKSTAHNSSS